jgi:hypothetical protein
MDPKTRKLWEGHGGDIVFQPEDFDILDLTLSLMPELRICAAAVKRARSAKLRYPISSPDQLNALLDNGKHASSGGHEIKAEDIPKYMPKEFFPIEHEGALISRIYIALIRCNQETMQKRVAPELLADFAAFSTKIQRIQGTQK